MKDGEDNGTHNTYLLIIFRNQFINLQGVISKIEKLLLIIFFFFKII